MERQRSTYLDSSLIVSLHSVDTNTKLASDAFLLAAQTPVITTLCQLEVVNALNLRAFRKEISPQQAAQSIQSFEEDVLAGAYALRQLPQSAFVRALKLSLEMTQMLGIRTADLLHVAAALELGADEFFTFDLQQRKLASAAGLNLNPI
jgi:predicted nucleic acid-binding protein